VVRGWDVQAGPTREIEASAVRAVGNDQRRPEADDVAQGVQLQVSRWGLGHEILDAGHQGVDLAELGDQVRRQCPQLKRRDLNARVEGTQPPLESCHPYRHSSSGAKAGCVQLPRNGRQEDRRGAGATDFVGCDPQLRAGYLKHQAAPRAALVDREADRGRHAMYQARAEVGQLGESRLRLELAARRGDGCHPSAGRRHRSRGMQHRPAGGGGSIGKAVDREAANDEQIGRRYHRAIMRLFFYELHEGATDLLTDAILVSEQELSPEAFAEMVLAARAAVVDTFEEDTLVEAIARELERTHGFTYAGDEKLTGSMAVGLAEDETFLVDVSPEYRSLIAELDRSS
jgi:hypothetical protein